MLGTIKKTVLQGASVTGVLRVAPYLTSDRLRILCYHGISFDREHLFSPGTFMRPETFQKRLQFLHDWGAIVLPLDEALARLYDGNLPTKAVCITIDDGWYGSFQHMLPALTEFGYPATLYSSTYYTEKQTFVFNLLVPYIFFCTPSGNLNLAELDARLSGEYALENATEKSQALEQILGFGERELDSEGRERLCYKVAAACAFDLAAAEEKRLFKFMSPEELSSLPARGFDVQLHTHRHVFSPEDQAAAEKELRENAEVLTRIGIQPCKHFCYPSGEFVPHHADWLENVGIQSAVTTRYGLVSKSTSPYFLNRVCDSEAMNFLDFEVAISGLKAFISR